MACTTVQFDYPEATPEQLCKVAIRLRMTLVKLTDAHALDADRVKTRTAWLETDEAQGSYLGFVQWSDDPWVRRFVGAFYAFSDPDTAFAFKMRFG